MENRMLGKTGLNVSVIGMGGIPFQRISQQEVTAVINRSLELGINFIDTARGYTISEELIGNAIEGQREKFILATKSMARTKEAMVKDIETSLKNLKTDYIDLYQFHLVKTDQELQTILGKDGAMEALLEAKAQGKVKWIGITGHNEHMMERAISTGKFDTLQFPYNLVETQGEELFKRAKELGMGVIIMKPMAGGAIKNVDLSLRFILQNHDVSVVIPGVDNMEQLEQNAGVGNSIRPLSLEELRVIEEERNELGSNFCRRCGYCLPCPEKIDIPTMFLFEGYYTRYELKDWTMARYGGVEFKPSDCIECGICESKCPYNLPIRDMLKNVRKVLGD